MFSHPTILAPERGTWLLRKYVTALEKKNLLKRIKVRNWRLLDKRKDVLYKTSPECSSSTLKVRGNYLRFSFAMNDWDKETNWKLKKISCLNHRASRTNVFFVVVVDFLLLFTTYKPFLWCYAKVPLMQFEKYLIIILARLWQDYPW